MRFQQHLVGAALSMPVSLPRHNWAGDPTQHRREWDEHGALFTRALHSCHLIAPPESDGLDESRDKPRRRATSRALSFASLTHSIASVTDRPSVAIIWVKASPASSSASSNARRPARSATLTATANVAIRSSFCSRSRRREMARSCITRRASTRSCDFVTIDSSHRSLVQGTSEGAS